MECYFCRNQMADNERYCPYCGGDQYAANSQAVDSQATVQMQYCPNCGASVLSSDINCHACGLQLQQAAFNTSYYAQGNMAVPVQDAGGTQLLTPEMEYYGYQQNQGAQQAYAQSGASQAAYGQQAAYDQPGAVYPNGVAPNGNSPVEATGKKKKRKLPVIILIIVLVLLLLAGVGIAVWFLFPGLFSGQQDKNLFYVKDNELFMANGLSNKPVPTLLTEDYYEDRDEFYGYMYSYIQESKDGKYVSYPANIEGNGCYDLYVMNLKNSKKEPVKVDGDVDTYTFLTNNKIVYQTENNSLYISDLKDKTKLASDVSNYWTANDNSYIMWTESNNEGTYELYYRNLNLKKEKKKIDSYISRVYASEDLNEIVFTKDDSLYLVKNWGDKEKLASDVTEVVATDFKDDKLLVYYTTESEALEVSDLLENDMDETGAWVLEAVEEEIEDEWKMSDIYVYDIKTGQNTLVDTFVLAEKMNSGTVLYAKLSIDEINKIKLSEIYTFNNMDVVLQNAMEDAVTAYVVYEGKSAVLDEEALYSGDDSYIASAYYMDEEQNYICYIVKEHDDLDVGDLKRFSLTGSKMGVPEEIDEEVESICIVTAGKIYYLKEYDDYSGELYCNGNFVADDVYRCQYSREKVVVQSDYDEGSYTMSIWDGKKMNKVSDDVYRSRLLSNDRIAVLFDYNTDKDRGELSVYDGKKLIPVDTDVAALY